MALQGLISVIVTTYERPDALDAVLRSLSHQSDPDFEVIVADDGSSRDTDLVVAAWQRRFAVPLKHVWQSDKGFRVARSRNRAVLASAGCYLIFLDGDCVARPNFVAAHRHLGEATYIVGGNRVWLSESLTREVLASGEAIETWPMRHWVREFARRRIDRPSPLLHLPAQFWRKWRPFATEKAIGCNAALYREDFFSVDGYDARFEDWGCEDLDLALRLRRAGIRYKSGKRATGVLHLWHPKTDGLPDAHIRFLQEASENEAVTAVIGLSSLALPELRRDAGNSLKGQAIDHGPLSA